MSARALHFVTTHCSALARIVFITFGSFAVIWALMTFPLFWRADLIVNTAKRIIAGEHYKLEVLSEQIPILEGIEKDQYCDPAAIGAATIIRIRMMEAATSEVEKNETKTQLNELVRRIVNSLSCSPADPFLWLALYSVENRRNGFAANQVQYLRLSYRLGPNEAWIGLRRNGLALSNFEHLPTDLQGVVLEEFVGLLNSGFERQMVANFTGPGVLFQDLILARMNEVAERPRQSFANALYRQGLDLIIPGTTRPEPRPWH